MAQQAHTRPRIDGDERNGGATCQVPLTGQADRTREYSAPERHGEAPVIVPSEMKGRKHPMTDDEFLWLLERERRELVTEQPVVTAEELGRMMFAAYLGMHSTAEDNGMQLLGQLERAGLTIVRSGEATK